jgi:hypothetical protein
VEAALLLPLTLLLILLLCQPTILLYNRVVMENAAAESCRLLATRVDLGDYGSAKYEGSIMRRLAAIPSVDIFHVGADARDWNITFEGSEQGSEVYVRIVNRVRPLPLLGWGAELLGQTDAQGYLTQTVEVHSPRQPSWVHPSTGDAEDWILQWD